MLTRTYKAVRFILDFPPAQHVARWVSEINLPRKLADRFSAEKPSKHSKGLASDNRAGPVGSLKVPSFGCSPGRGVAARVRHRKLGRGRGRNSSDSDEMGPNAGGKKSHFMRRTPFQSVFWMTCAAAAVGLVSVAAYFYLLPKVVTGFVVDARPAVLEIRGPALLDAINKVIVTARIQGFLKSVKVDKNDNVVAGQILAEIESEDLESQLMAAQADATAAEHAVSEARDSLEGVNALADKARVEFERKRSLVPSGSASQADLTTAEAAHKQAQADLARARVTIDRLLAQLGSARANVRLLQARLNDATIRSSLDGVVVNRNRNVGDLLTPSVALMEVVDPSTVILTARYDKSVMGTIRPGQKATARFTAEPGRSFRGTVLRLIRQVDQETREFEADIKLDELPATWALDQRATVVIEANDPVPTLAISRDLIDRRRGHVGVWKLERGRAVWIPVALGYPAGGSVQIVGGLDPGDVVLDPHGRYEFEPVSLREEPVDQRGASR